VVFLSRLKTLSMKTKLVSMVLVLTVCCILAVTYVVETKLTQSMRSILEGQQFAAVSYIAADLNARIQLRMELLESIALRFTPAVLADPEAARQELAQLPALRTLFKGGVVLIAQNGHGIADYPPVPGRGAGAFEDQEYFKQVLVTRESVLGKPRIGRFSKLPGVTFSVPVKDDSGGVIGVLAALATLADPTLFGQVESAKMGQSGYIAVSAPKHGLIVSSSDPRRILQPFAKPGQNKMFDRFLAGFEGSGVAVNSFGVETLTSAKQIPATGWFAQLVLPTKEAFAPIYEMRRLAYSLAAILSLAAAFVFWRMISALLAPLVQASQSVLEMSAGSRELEPLPVSHPDEVGLLLTNFNLLVEERKLQEATLRRSEERFRAIYDQSPLGIALIDSGTGRFLHVNPKYTELIGYSKDELLALDFMQISHPADLPQDLDNMARLLAGEIHSFYMEKRLIRRSGASFWVSLTVVPLLGETQEGPCHLAMIEDIAERKASQTILQEREAFIRGILDSIPAHVAILDRSGDIVAANEAWRRFGRQNGLPDEYWSTPRNYLDACAAELRNSDDTTAGFAVSKIASLLRGETDKFVFEYPCHSQDVKRWFSMECCSLANHASGGFVVVHSDVTTLKITEESLRQSYILLENKVRERTLALSQTVTALEEARNQAVSANEVKDAFLARVSHELRTPLNPIIGMLQLVLEDRLTLQQREYLTEAYKSAEALHVLVDELVEYIRLKSRQPVQAVFDFKSFLYSVGKEVAPAIKAKCLAFNIDYARNEEAVILMDQELLHGVVLKLIENAVKFTEAGAISLTASLEQSLGEQATCRIAVSDTGIGMAPERITAITEGFTQADDPISRRFGGLGLGMAVVRRSLQQLGGTLEITSVPGQGSTFCLCLPVRDCSNDRLDACLFDLGVA